MDEILNVEVSY